VLGGVIILKQRKLLYVKGLPIKILLFQKTSYSCSGKCKSRRISTISCNFSKDPALYQINLKLVKNPDFGKMLDLIGKNV
jgi:hypothetical protein